MDKFEWISKTFNEINKTNIDQNIILEVLIKRSNDYEKRLSKLEGRLNDV